MMKMPTERPSSRRLFECRQMAVARMAALALAAALASGFGRATAGETTLTNPPRFEMKGNLLTFNGQPLRFEDRLETWSHALGTPSTSDDSRHRWYGAGIEVWAPRTVDGRSYVKTLIVRMGEHGFPGVFVLQGVAIRRGGPPFKVVQAALQGTDTPFWGLGRDRLPESGKMKVHSPDGFEVTVAARLDCLPRLPPGSKEDCEQTIDELEIGSAW